jgi:hypothetical protein
MRCSLLLTFLSFDIIPTISSLLCDVSLLLLQPFIHNFTGNIHPDLEDLNFSGSFAFGNL